MALGSVLHRFLAEIWEVCVAAAVLRIPFFWVSATLRHYVIQRGGATELVRKVHRAFSFYIRADSSVPLFDAAYSLFGFPLSLFHITFLFFLVFAAVSPSVFLVLSVHKRRSKKSPVASKVSNLTLP